MRLATVYARFFRSLNYDYLRKSHPDYRPDPWDATPSGLDYPFVWVRLEQDITTVVGANESGKSQLLDAIKCGLTGEGVERGDFCRYSPFFSTDSTLILPEFGLGLCDASDEDRSAIAAACELDEIPNVSRAELFRMNETPKLRLYIHDGATWIMRAVKKPTALKQLGLPSFFEIDSKVPLPDAVPIEFLATGDVSTATGRDSHRQRWDKIMEKGSEWFASREALQSSADEVVATFANITAIDDKTRKKYELADDLLGRDTHDGLESVLRGHLNDAEFHLDKIGFARSVLASVSVGGEGDAALPRLEANFKVLLGSLAKLQRGADREASAEKIRSRVNRVRRRFATDHPHSARREDVLL